MRNETNQLTPYEEWLNSQNFDENGFTGVVTSPIGGKQGVLKVYQAGDQGVITGSRFYPLSDAQSDSQLKELVIKQDELSAYDPKLAATEQSIFDLTKG